MDPYRQLGSIEDYSIRPHDLVLNVKTGDVARVTRAGGYYPGPTLEVNWDCVCCYEIWETNDCTRVDYWSEATAHALGNNDACLR